MPIKRALANCTCTPIMCQMDCPACGGPARKTPCLTGPHFNGCKREHPTDELCDSRICDWCDDNEVTTETCAIHYTGWSKTIQYVCTRCDNYDGPSDDDLSEFYGGGGVRPMSEQYAEAAEQKRNLR